MTEPTRPLKKDISDSAPFTPHKTSKTAKLYFRKSGSTSRKYWRAEDEITINLGDASDHNFTIERIHPEPAADTEAPTTVEPETPPISENIARKLRAYQKLAVILRDDEVEQEYLDEDFDALELFD